MSVEVVLSRSLMEAVRDASFAFLLFLLHVICSCKVSFDVARDARSLFVCARYTYLLYQGSESVFMLIQIVLILMCLTHLEPHGTESVGVKRSVIRIVNCWIVEQIITSPRVIASQSSSSTRHQHI